MASKTNAGENDLLKYVFNGVTPGWDTRANLWLSLHTASPGETGTQSTNEASYGGYKRVGVSRASGWDVSGNVASNAVTVEFPQVVSGTETVTHLGIGTDQNGAGTLLYYGAFDDVNVKTSSVVRFLAGSIVIEEK